MNHERFVVVANVAKTHGLKGEVSVAPATGTPFDSLIGAQVWFTPPPLGVRSSAIVDVRPGPKGPLVLFDGIDSISSAQGLVGTQVLVARESLPEGWGDEVEDEGVEGYSVVDVTRGVLGEIVETIITGANDVWVVEGPYGEVLIPVIDDVVICVDEDEATIEVRLLDGLLDEEGEGA